MMRLATLGESAGLDGLSGLSVGHGRYKTGTDGAVVQWTRNLVGGESMGIEDEGEDKERLGEEHGTEPAREKERIKERRRRRWRRKVQIRQRDISLGFIVVYLASWHLLPHTFGPSPCPPSRRGCARRHRSAPATACSRAGSVRPES